ncbi:ADP-glucose phosphorylase-like [Hibiscus syriacus]|uniref:ADP-glucose phosphorylase-like n=1 Tax=Hibiscus syriacus TaxID=106335 RepID=UPI00192512D0|nr:ADP-glucose phosphorylase-like [Hibiscus syriacus]
MSHSHSQIIALPIVPSNVSVRLDSMEEYFYQTGKCSLCEVQSKDLLINETSHFISITPFAALFPFEMWIIPGYHTSHFDELDKEKAVDLGHLLKLILKKMSAQLNNPPFNFMIHNSPVHVADSKLPYSHWFLQIIPQLTGIGGFELGSGCYINPVFPDDAAKILRELDVPVQG